MKLDNSERSLLIWLAESDASQYGECYGTALDSLIGKGLAEVLDAESGTQNAFIAKGSGLMYRAVRLTDVGRKALRNE